VDHRTPRGRLIPEGTDSAAQAALSFQDVGSAHRLIGVTVDGHGCNEAAQNRKENIMTKSKNLPLYRAKYCVVIGQDEDGKDKLSRAVEIGAAFSRKDPSKGAILKLDIVPQDLRNGVLFLDPVQSDTRGYA